MSVTSPGFFRALVSMRTTAGATGLAPVLLLLGLSGVERFDYTAFGVLGPEIRAQFHLTSAGYLSITSLTVVLPLFATPHLGNLSDRFNRVQLAMIGGLVWGVTAVLTGLAPTVLALVLARLAGGVGITVNMPTHPSLLSDWYARDVLPTVYGWYLIAPAAIGLVAGPLAGSITAASSWRVAFVILAVPTLVFALLLLRLREPARGHSMGREHPPARAGGVLRSFGHLARVRSLRRIWVAATFFGSGVVIFATLLSLYFQDVYHYGPGLRGAIAALFGLGGLAGLLAGGATGRMLVARGRAEVLPVVIGAMFLVGFGGGMLLMALAPSGPVAVGAVLIVAIANGGWGPAYLTMVALISPAHLRGQAFAWSTLWFSLGAVVASPVIGHVGDVWGQRWAVGVLALLVAIAGVLNFWVASVIAGDLVESRAQA
ncbi:MAG TPA: MFS transporter [Candidatus Dormibacteraeota bacterium]|nr:MFS transporter [Candidatus Dormibacteraeota bacterium]